MRNLVHPFERGLVMERLAKYFAVMFLLTGCSVHAQQPTDSTVSPDGDAMVLRGERGHILNISVDRDGVWSAVLDGRGERAVVTSSTCPAFASAMEAFRTLPGIKPGPYAIQATPDIRPIPPTTMDGESWSITAPGFAPDWTSVVVTIDGDQGPYARWASSMVRTIRSCSGE